MTALETYYKLLRSELPEVKNDPYKEIRDSLYKEHVLTLPHSIRWYNKSRIDYVIDNVYSKQITRSNPWENVVKNWLTSHNIPYKFQEFIPILKKGGKIEHLYLADFVVGNTIIEVDGKQHNKQKEKDKLRDQQTEALGYKTIRIPTKDLFQPKLLEKYLKSLLTTK